MKKKHEQYCTFGKCAYNLRNECIHHQYNVCEYRKLEEKNKPKKPIEKEDSYCYCGSCGSVLSAGYYYRASYCHSCGTKIDWS